MRSVFFVLPFISLLSGTLGTAIANSSQYKMAFPIGWTIAILLTLAWFIIERNNFKRVFQRKGAKYGAASGIVVLLGVALIISLAILSQRPRFNKIWDVTSIKSNSLSPQSIKIVESINQANVDVKLRAYFKSKNAEASFRDLMDIYKSAGLKIQTEFFDIQAEPVKAMADNVTSANTVIFKLNNVESRITIFNEEKITNALIKLLKAKQKKIYFLTGHGENSLKSDETTGFSFANRMLENESYLIENLSLNDTGIVPNDADMLVLAGLKYDLQHQEVSQILEFINSGGGLLVAIDAVVSIPNVVNLVSKFGVKINNDIILLPPDDTRVKHYGQNNAFITEFDEFNIVTKDFSKGSQVDLIMPFTRSLSMLDSNEMNFKVELPAKSSNRMIKISDVEKQEDLNHVTENRLDTTGNFPVMAVSFSTSKKNEQSSNEDKNKKSRIIVVGSSSFMKNQIIQGSMISQDLFMNIINYILKDDDFISIRPKNTNQSTLSISSQSSQIFLFIVCVLYPLMFLFFGTFFWFKRKNT